MLEGLAFLAYASYSGGSIGNLIARMEAAGAFTYALPFLLIFALVFGILAKLDIFKENRAISAIIALVVGAMSLQFNIVSTFFAEIFPRLGIGLSVILVLLVISGLFINPKNKGWTVGLGIISLIIVAIVVYTSFENWPWTYSVWFQNNWASVIGILIFVGLVVAIIATSAGKDNKSPLAKALLGTEGK